MRAIVTGAAGFIGSHLCDLLIADGHEVIGIDNLACGRLSNLQQLQNHKNFRFEKLDICDAAALKKVCEGSQWVFHLAGLADIVPSIEKPTEYVSVNVQGTLNVLEAIRDQNISKLVYAASSSCYGLAKQFPTSELSPVVPEYPYAFSKWVGEETVLHWGKVYQIPVVSMRLFNVYGPRSRTTGAYGAVFGVFLKQKLAGKPFTVVGDGKQTRDFTFVTDVARAFYAAAKSDVKQEVFNVGSGNHYSVNRLVQLLGGDIVHIPKRPGEPDCTFADTQKIKTMLHWQPKVNFEAGVGKMLEHIQDWKDAPLWDEASIAEATRVWFERLGK